MELTDALQSTLARINRLRALRSGHVVDLERVRLKRELAALRGRLTPDQWQAFLHELVGALASRMRVSGLVAAARDEQAGE